jgi:hypothetical protein
MRRDRYRYREVGSKFRETLELRRHITRFHRCRPEPVAGSAGARVPHGAALSRDLRGASRWRDPTAAALEREIVTLGVAEKQRDKARQHGRNRLVMPGIAGTQREEDKVRDEDKGNGGGSGGEPPAIDPIIAGLLERFPKSGATWPKAQRKLWLGLLEGSFDLIYVDKDEAAK